MRGNVLVLERAASKCQAQRSRLVEFNLAFGSILKGSIGRRVLFEIIAPDGTLVDTTLGYSSRWVDTFLPDTISNGTDSFTRASTPLTPMLSLKRGRNGLSRKGRRTKKTK